MATSSVPYQLLSTLKEMLNHFLTSSLEKKASQRHQSATHATARPPRGIKKKSRNDHNIWKRVMTLVLGDETSHAYSHGSGARLYVDWADLDLAT